MQAFAGLRIHLRIDFSKHINTRRRHLVVWIVFVQRLGRNLNGDYPFKLR